MEAKSKKWTRIAIKAVLLIPALGLFGLAKEASSAIGQIAALGLMAGILYYSPKEKPTPTAKED